MLNTFAHHNLLNLQMTYQKNLKINAHHTIKDIEICLDQTLSETLNTKSEISKFKHNYVPINKTLTKNCVDLSNKPYLIYETKLEEKIINTFPTILCEEFFQSLTIHNQMNLHINLIKDSNTHHSIETMFKTIAHALRLTFEPNPQVNRIPSTKNIL